MDKKHMDQSKSARDANSAEPFLPEHMDIKKCYAWNIDVEVWPENVNSWHLGFSVSAKGRCNYGVDIFQIDSAAQLKFMFSKKAAKIDEIFTVDLQVTSYCQIDREDFVNFCGLLRKRELYLLL